jgi:hypothetical protein
MIFSTTALAKSSITRERRGGQGLPDLSALCDTRLNGTFVLLRCYSNLIGRKAFSPERLNSSIPNSSMQENFAIMIASRNQTVYWKGCNVTVYEYNSNGAERTTQLRDWPNGQGTLPFGMKLYITKGRLREE